MYKVFTGLAQTLRDNGAGPARQKAKAAAPGSYDEGFWEGVVCGFEAAATEAMKLALVAKDQEEQAAKVIPLHRKEGN
jgi:ABC-type sugar transport system substrate-binding protein